MHELCLQFSEAIQLKFLRTPLTVPLEAAVKDYYNDKKFN